MCRDPLQKAALERNGMNNISYNRKLNYELNINKYWSVHVQHMCIRYIEIYVICTAIIQINVFLV